MADHCSMWAEYHHCVDPDQGDDGFKQFTLEQYKTSSFCVTSTLGTSSISQESKSRCYPYVCKYAPDVLAIALTIGTYTVNCLRSEGGIRKTISALTGYLECPVYDDFCVNSRKICKNWCSKNGICTRGICNCYPGYSGDDCSKTICTSTQFYNPADNTCGLACPSGTYQNKYAKTCLPCASTCNECVNEPQICSSCHSTVSNPKVFYKGLCQISCPKRTFKIGDSCFDCNTDTAFCFNCTGTATNCTSCPENYILDGPTSGTCGTTCSNANYLVQDRVNRKCVNNCIDNLVVGMDGQINICILCPLGQFKRISNVGCHTTCQ